MQFRRVKRHITGVLLLDKPAGISSNGALQQVKRLYQAEKAGHTGNLDPFATGLLPVCLGEATKFSQFLLDSDKTYQALMRLGITTATGDIEGEILRQREIAYSDRLLAEVISRFTGKISQIPPMYSALKHQGKALYHYARAGVEIERQPRDVTIYSLEVNERSGDLISFTVACSKGTYIRTLAEDIGEALGCGAHLRSLRRTAIGRLSIDRAQTLEQLELMDAMQRDALLLSADSLLTDFPRIDLNADSAYYLQQGQAVWLGSLEVSGVVRLYDEKQSFIGLGAVTEGGRVAPRRLVVHRVNQ